MPTLRTPKDRLTDVCLGSNSLKRRAQVIAQLHQGVRTEGHNHGARVLESGSQLLDTISKARFTGVIWLDAAARYLVPHAD